MGRFDDKSPDAGSEGNFLDDVKILDDAKILDDVKILDEMMKFQK